MLSNAFSYSSQLFYAANFHCSALQKVVQVIVGLMEEEHQLLENFMGCIVYVGIRIESLY